MSIESKLDMMKERLDRVDLSLAAQLSKSMRMNAALISRNADLRKAIDDIKQATIDGKVCDDIAWMDTITTLHDFCCQALDADLKRQGDDWIKSGEDSRHD